MTPWAIACQTLLSIGFCRQEYWRGVLLPPLRHPPYSGIEPLCLVSSALAGGIFTTSTTCEAPILHFTSRTSKSQRGGVLSKVTQQVKKQYWDLNSALEINPEYSLEGLMLKLNSGTLVI